MIPANLSGQQLLNFIGGRKHYNNWRQMCAITRQHRLLFKWAENPTWRKADLARHFKVSKATISRDLAAIKARHRRYYKCPVCDGKGSLDLGPDLATLAEVVSDLKRTMPYLFNKERNGES